MADTPTNPDHYSRWNIQPWDFISQNKLDFMRGNIIKYIMRYDAKNGLEDLKKARVYLDKLISMNAVENNDPSPQEDSVSRVWTVSTANITKEDNAILARNAFNADTEKGNKFIFRTDAVFLIPVDDAAHFPSGLTEYAFLKLYGEALRAGISWLDLDRDADPAPGFEIFGW